MPDVNVYITGGGLRAAVEGMVAEYEGLTFIDAFMQNSVPKWFYEWTLQGFIYQAIARNYDIVATGGYKNYAIFLEQPYSPNNLEFRSDLMLVSLETEIVSAIEIKSNFNLGSMYADMVVLNDQINSGNIGIGYGIYFAHEQGEIDDWNTAFSQDATIGPNIAAHKLYSVGIVGNPE